MNLAQYEKRIRDVVGVGRPWVFHGRPWVMNAVKMPNGEWRSQWGHNPGGIVDGDAHVVTTYENAVSDKDFAGSLLGAIREERVSFVQLDAFQKRLLRLARKHNWPSWPDGTPAQEVLKNWMPSRRPKQSPPQETNNEKPIIP